MCASARWLTRGFVNETGDEAWAGCGARRAKARARTTTRPRHLLALVALLALVEILGHFEVSGLFRAHGRAGSAFHLTSLGMARSKDRGAKKAAVHRLPSVLTLTPSVVNSPFYPVAPAPRLPINRVFSNDSPGTAQALVEAREDSAGFSSAGRPRPRPRERSAHRRRSRPARRGWSSPPARSAPAAAATARRCRCGCRIRRPRSCPRPSSLRKPSTNQLVASGVSLQQIDQDRFVLAVQGIAEDERAQVGGEGPRGAGVADVAGGGLVQSGLGAVHVRGPVTDALQRLSTFSGPPSSAKSRLAAVLSLYRTERRPARARSCRCPRAPW